MPSLYKPNRIFAIFALVCLITTGCALVKLNQDLRDSDLLTVIVGWIEAPSPVNGPIIVAAYAKYKGQREVAHYTILHDRGEFELMVPKGTYYVFAYIDQNSNLVYDSGEPAAQHGKPKAIAAKAGGVVPGINIVIAKPGRPIDWPIGHAITMDKPQKLYSRLAGVIADLDDERFAEEHGGKGFWEPVSFYKTFGGTIYFLEEYDPQKIPILFVHGAGGTPKGWKFIVDHIDRTRFQPWFFYYPTGTRMRSMSHLLLWKLLSLQAKYKYDTLYITAHSMGGLIARSLIQDHATEFPYVKLFISMATPWGGDKMAEYGVRQSPAVIPSWIDMQPEGEFIQSLYRNKIPETVDFYLFYGHRGNRNPFRSNNDGTITLSSLLDRRPQADAKMSYAFDEDHASIIYSKEVVDQYNLIINAFDAEHRTTGGTSVGYLTLNFSYDYPDNGTRPWPRLILRAKDKKQKERVVVLTPGDNGKALGPFPIGSYSACLIAEGLKTHKRWVPVSIESHQNNALRFVLTLDGMIAGYIESAAVQEQKVAGMPDWQRRPENNDIQLESITVKGAGVQRTIHSYDIDTFNWFDMEVTRTDYCGNGYFRLFGLPAGPYELTVKAKGHKPLKETHMVVPGREGDFRFLKMTPEE